MKNLLLLIVSFFLLSCYACSSKKNLTENSSAENSGRKINLGISLAAENLSEDGSKLFSQNDEIVFLAYAVSTDTAKLPELILSQYFVFDSLKRNAEFISDSFTFPVKGNLCFVLIEIDDDKTKEQIEPVVRLNFQAINNAYLKKDAMTLNKFLGDNDMLGIKSLDPEKINWNKANTIIISGAQLLDTYQYDMTIKKIK